MTDPTRHRFVATDSSGQVSALLLRPDDARALYVYAHGAGAGMSHAFMEATARRLHDRGVATLRYQFPYMEAGRGGPNRPPILIETVRSAVAAAGVLAPDLPLVAGGKSMGGRMTSTAAAKEPLVDVRGLAFFGFPLHPSGKPSTARGDHLADVGLPMLFLQGTRDKLADLDLLRPVLATVRPEPTVAVLEGADHGFHVLRRSGRTDDEVLDEACDRFVAWVDAVV